MDRLSVKKLIKHFHISGLTNYVMIDYQAANQ